MNNVSLLFRSALPQCTDQAFLTDGGLETTLVYHENWELPEFAAFTLLDSASGMASLNAYYQRYISLALRYGMGFILESPTWRANPAWGSLLGYSEAELVRINQKAIGLMVSLRNMFTTTGAPIVISGCLGPQDDGYAPDQLMTAEQAAAYHQLQTRTFAESQADMVCAITMTYAEEAIGIAHAARKAGIPAAISFTVETDGALPSGQPLHEAIVQVDAETNGYPAYYMVNCAHPSHFIDKLVDQGQWRERIMGIRANASRKSHAELDCATTLDEGDPSDFGQQYLRLKQVLPKLSVFGGCCGTDHRHVEAIAEACFATAPRPAVQPA